MTSPASTVPTVPGQHGDHHHRHGHRYRRRRSAASRSRSDGGTSWQRPQAARPGPTPGRRVARATRHDPQPGRRRQRQPRQPVDPITVTVGFGPVTCPCSIWGARRSSRRPVRRRKPTPVELGTRFRADRHGNITAIRFYKSPQNVGPHIGNLWSAGGTLLATVHVRRRDSVLAGRKPRYRHRWPFWRIPATSFRTTPPLASTPPTVVTSRRPGSTRAAPRVARRPGRTERGLSVRPERLSGAVFQQRELLGRRRLRQHRRCGHAAAGGDRRHACSRHNHCVGERPGDGHLQ